MIRKRTILVVVLLCSVGAFVASGTDVLGSDESAECDSFTITKNLSQEALENRTNNTGDGFSLDGGSLVGLVTGVIEEDKPCGGRLANATASGSQNETVTAT